MDKEATYADELTSTVVAPTKIATTLENDCYCIKSAVKRCNSLDFNDVKLVRIKNTLELGEIEVSEALLVYVKNHDSMVVLSEPTAFQFDDDGNLMDQ